MTRVSAKGQAKAMRQQEVALLKGSKGKPQISAATADSFINFAQGVGLGAQNGLMGGTYGFNPITRNRILLEWIHRGSWLGGMAVDVLGDDMTRKGVEIVSEMAPEDVQKIESEIERLGVWDKVNQTVKWGRLYGGALGVALIDGQDMRTPLRLETVGSGQFRGMLALDRWMLQPELGDLVTEFGPHLGQPKYYRVLDTAPALRGMAIHHSRVLVRHLGVELPYQQALTENLWGISIFERFYDRMIGFDTATMGAAQLVTKAYLRTLSVKDLRSIVAAGGDMLKGLTSYVHTMRQFQNNEGVTVIDADDTFEVQQSSAFSGVADVILQLAQQVSGALGIPLVRLLGQSPAGLNSTGESDWRNYYDNINARQNKDLSEGIVTTYKLAGQSLGIKVPDDFQTEFRPLYDLSEEEKADVADKTVDAVTKAKDAGLFGTKTALKELKQSSVRTGIFSNITQEQIDLADDEIAPPMSEQLLEAADLDPDRNSPALTGKNLPGEEKGGKDGDKTGSDSKTRTVDAGTRRRIFL